MTPRQLHALEWAVKNSEVYVKENQICALPSVRKEHEYLMLEARRALAYAWREYREQQSAARIKPARRELQTVPR